MCLNPLIGEQRKPHQRNRFKQEYVELLKRLNVRQSLGE
jgi:hypothetical protein